MLNLLKLIYVFLGINMLGGGVALCTRMVTGQPFEAWVKNFLRFSLLFSSVGLILSISHTGITQLPTMLTVYLSGFAVYSWRKYGASDSWGPVVVLTTISVFCLQIVVVAAEVIGALAAHSLLGSNENHTPMGVLIGTVVLLFAFVSTISLKRIHQHPSAPVMHRAAR